MDAREQLLQSLMRDLETFKMPERYSAEQQAQIMKGRDKRGQAVIDEGRRAIADNERLYQEAVTKRGALQERIAKLQTEVDAARTKAEQDDPVNQAAQYGKSIGIPLATYGLGHEIAKRTGKSHDINPAKRGADVKGLANTLRGIDPMSPASKAQASGTVHAYDKMPKGRGVGQFAIPFALGGVSFATKAGADYADDPYLKEGLNIASTAERTGAAGMLIQQVIDTLKNRNAVREAIDPTDIAAIEAARRQLNESGKYGRVQGRLSSAPPSPMGWTPPAPQTPSLPPPASAAPAAPVAALPPPAAPEPQRHADRLANAARAAGASGKLTKEEAAAFLASNITDANRGAVGEALGVKRGPNFAKRISAAVKNMASTRGASSIALPLAAGAIAASSTESEAADGGSGSWTDPLITGGVGAGGFAAGQYALSKLPQSVGTAFGAGLPAMLPSTIDDMTNYSSDDLAEMRNTLARNLPDWMRVGAVEDAYQMAQVPEPNPMRMQSRLPYGAMGFGLPRR